MRRTIKKTDKGIYFVRAKDKDQFDLGMKMTKNMDDMMDYLTQSARETGAMNVDFTANYPHDRHFTYSFRRYATSKD